MKRAVKKIKPASGFSHIFHIVLTVVLPVLLYILVRLNLPQFAVLMIVLSKWRIVSVRPRYWFMLIKANAVDIIVGISTVIFMVNTNSGVTQLGWAAIYALWLTVIKPRAGVGGISLQAFASLLYGLSAVYLEWGAAGSIILMVLTWLVCYIAASHYFSSFDEKNAAFLVNTWALFGASLAWILSHWLLYYRVFSQVTVLLVVLGFGFGTLYYLSKTARLTVMLKRQIVFIMLAVIIITVLFSDWSDKTI